MPRLRLAPLLLVLAAIAPAACDRAAAPVPVEPHATSLIEVQGWLMTEYPRFMILVVDDAPTADAAALREAIAGSFRAGLEHIQGERFGNCGNRDPAAWHPGDVRVVVARPSAPEGAALLTPIERPGLAWITRTSSDDEMEALMAAVIAALGERTAQPGEVYRPLRAAQRALDLVAGARPPESDAEAAFAASLPAPRAVQLVVASTRDDEDTAPLAQLAPSQVAQDGVSAIEVVGPFGPQPYTCEVDQPDGSRLATWAEATWAPLTTWPCAGDLAWDGLFITGYIDCGPACRSAPLPVREGVASCRIFVEQTDLAGCDPARGWRDPGGQPTLVSRDDWTLRRCEVAQLEGAALASCREDLACSGCPSGWCATEVADALPWGSCEPGTYTWPLRFVGGALDAPSGWIDIACEVSETE